MAKALSVPIGRDPFCFEVGDLLDKGTYKLITVIWPRETDVMEPSRKTLL